MKKSQLENTEKLLNLKFQRKQNLVSSLNAQEARLRAQIKQIDEQDARAEQSASRQMRSIGADVIWKSWVGRTKETLNLELAQVLAQKEILLKGVRREYGKVLVARELIAKENKNSKNAEAKDLLLQTMNPALFR